MQKASRQLTILVSLIFGSHVLSATAQTPPYSNNQAAYGPQYGTTQYSVQSPAHGQYSGIQGAYNPNAYSNQVPPNQQYYRPSTQGQGVQYTLPPQYSTGTQYRTPTYGGTQYITPNQYGTQTQYATPNQYGTSQYPLQLQYNSQTGLYLDPQTGIYYRRQYNTQTGQFVNVPVNRQYGQSTPQYSGQYGRPVYSGQTGQYNPQYTSQAGQYNPQYTRPTGQYNPQYTTQTGQYNPQYTTPTGQYNPQYTRPTGQYNPQYTTPTGQYNPQYTTPTGQYNPQYTTPTGQYNPQYGTRPGQYNPQYGTRPGPYNPPFNTLPPFMPNDLGSVLQRLGTFTAVNLIQSAGLYSTIANSQDPLTLFIPTDAAFNRLPQDLLQKITTNRTELAKLLSYHVVPGAVTSQDLSNDLEGESVEGSKVRINIYQNGRVITANGAPIVAFDRMATNGVIHVIDKVMMPIGTGDVFEVVANDFNFSTLVSALSRTNLVFALKEPGPFTLFAPTNDAFNNLPPGLLNALMSDMNALTEVLKYHVVSGTGYSAGFSNGQMVDTMVPGKASRVTIYGPNGPYLINNVPITEEDQHAKNGVVHTIEQVMIPPNLYLNPNPDPIQQLLNMVPSK
ncbi:uncharacterized protein LOC106177537 [Lingula anatina]|uniref:Uncharacterized protein LOC106177537 n=1 Tax=Lingula anatina TaxID=7574 RepID=A0A1S3JZI0_LINAN|nr:uncharacterized protein LOC106177537 [Lingula anatina]|eukprot:XP_013415803.1 uncharacterized protein LOC106177537 [Lingula anatina]